MSSQSPQSPQSPNKLRQPLLPPEYLYQVDDRSQLEKLLTNKIARSLSLLNIARVHNAPTSNI